MAKQTGLGDNLYVGGFDLSGDVGSIQTIHGGCAVLDVTGIDKSAFERLGGLRDGSIEFTGYFNDSIGQAHKALSALPYTDVQVMYIRGKATGNQSACCVAKQINYDPTRANDGGLTITTQAQANGTGVEWGQQLTDGKTTATGAGNGTSVDNGASSAFGAQAYLQVFGVTGTSATVTIQDSADNATFATLSGMAFTAATAAGTQRLAIANNATVRRYVRVAITGTFTSFTFAVMFVRNEVAGVSF